MLIVLLSIILSLSLAAIVAAGLWLYDLRRQFQQQATEMERLRRDMRAVCAGSIGVGVRLNQFEELVKQLKSRQDKVELREPEVASYAHATKLVEMGATLDEIMVTCGLTRAEAELLQVMHQKETATSQARYQVA